MALLKYHTPIAIIFAALLGNTLALTITSAPSNFEVGQTYVLTYIPKNDVVGTSSIVRF